MKTKLMEIIRVSSDLADQLAYCTNTAPLSNTSKYGNTTGQYISYTRTSEILHQKREDSEIFPCASITIRIVILIKIYLNVTQSNVQTGEQSSIRFSTTL